MMLFSTVISTSLTIRNLARLRNRSKSAGINIGGMFKLLKKYEEFSKTKWGAFLNGFFFGIISDVVSGKAAVKCEESQFWGVVECFVGGADASLDSYYASFGQSYKDLPDSAVSQIVDIDSQSVQLGADPDVTQIMAQSTGDNSITGYLKAGWDWFKTKVNKAVDAAKKKLSGYWDKIKSFFESPLIKGIVQVGGCVMSKQWVKDAILKAILELLATSLGIPLGSKIYNIIKNAPLIFKELKGLYNTLKTTITRTYESPQQKYYTYGKAVADFFTTIVKILKVAMKMKRFRKLFK